MMNPYIPLPHAARNPHGGIHKVISWIARVHAHVQAELVQARIDAVRRSLVAQHG